MPEDATAAAEARVEQAEQLLDQARERGSRFLLRTLARAREEAEDIWAEAKSTRPTGRP